MDTWLGAAALGIGNYVVKAKEAATSFDPSHISKLQLFVLANALDATAVAFSAISGLNVISEKDAKKSVKKATAITLKELFYNPTQQRDQLFYIPDSEYAPSFDYDFTNYTGDDSNCTRGGRPYTRPSGWQRKAVSVLGRYEDDVWLGELGRRDESTPGEWMVSYHGTKKDHVQGIVMGGYDTYKCKRNMYGDGIYSTPDPKIAEDYASNFVYKGENFKCILQNRVDPQQTNVVRDGTYFVTPDHEFVRPYGICLKKM